MFLLLCRDKPNSLQLRIDTRSEHLAYVAEHAELVKIAGPTLDDDGQPDGSMFILDTDDRSVVEAFAASDPYARVGLFGHTRLMRWRQVVPAP